MRGQEITGSIELLEAPQGMQISLYDKALILQTVQAATLDDLRRLS